VSEFMLFMKGQGLSDDAAASATVGMHNVKRKGGGGSSLVREGVGSDDERYAARPATMPHGDDGRSQRAFDRATLGGKKGGALAAALSHRDSDDGGGGERGRGSSRVAASSLGRYKVTPVVHKRGKHAKKAGGVGAFEEVDEEEMEVEQGETEMEEEEEEEDSGDEFRAVPTHLGQREGDTSGGNGGSGGGGGGGGRRSAGGTRAVMDGGGGGGGGGGSSRTMRSQRMEYGATHKEALDQLETSIRNTVKAAHRSRKQGRK
jgi:hypothetical protein